MTCPHCVSWGQSDPNCGHAMLGDIWLPARFTTRAFIHNFELGRRAAAYLDAENGGHRTMREEHVDRQVQYAAAGGWKRSA